MLPFLMKRNQTGISGMTTEHRKSDESKESEPSDKSGLEAAAEDILRAIEDKDSKHLALALQAAYDMCESSEPEEMSEEDQDNEGNR